MIDMMAEESLTAPETHHSSAASTSSRYSLVKSISASLQLSFRHAHDDMVPSFQRYYILLLFPFLSSR